MSKNGIGGLNGSSKENQYLLFKDNLNLEKYMINDSNFYYSKIIKYMTNTHLLQVELYTINERKCNVCTTDDIGDEYHVYFLYTFISFVACAWPLIKIYSVLTAAKKNKAICSRFLLCKHRIYV